MCFIHYLIFFLFFLQSNVAYSEQWIRTIYGDCLVTEPVIEELLQTRAFNRLKGINQYGIVHYIHQGNVPYTRYTHSLGVFYLLRMFGASIHEQIAGLLHDVSHTVFSHVGDHLMDAAHAAIDQTQDAYQDENHVWILAQTDIADVLLKYDISLASINHKNGNFHMLERELPDICADRLEYNLYGGYVEGWLTQEEIHEIIAALHYQDGKWFFDDISQAKKLAHISLRLCAELFASPFNAGSYTTTAQALMRAVDINLIKYQDILFGQDDELFTKLTESNDEIIKACMNKALHAKEWYVVSDDTAYDLTYIGKFRGINPWVHIGDKRMRLTECDTEFRTHYERVRHHVCARKYCRCIPID